MRWSNQQPHSSESTPIRNASQTRNWFPSHCVSNNRHQNIPTLHRVLTELNWAAAPLLFFFSSLAVDSSDGGCGSSFWVSVGDSALSDIFSLTATSGRSNGFRPPKLERRFATYAFSYWIGGSTKTGYHWPRVVANTDAYWLGLNVNFCYVTGLVNRTRKSLDATPCPRLAVRSVRYYILTLLFMRYINIVSRKFQN